MFDQSNAYLPDDPTGGAELIFMWTGHYSNDNNDEIQNQKKVQSSYQQFLKLQMQNEDNQENILVTIDSHRQVVMNPEQLAHQNEKFLPSGFSNQQNKQQEETHEQHIPLYDYFYDKIAKAHFKAMPEFLKPNQQSPDKNKEEEETSKQIQEAKLLEEQRIEEQIKEDFPVTIVDIQEKFRQEDSQPPVHQVNIREQQFYPQQLAPQIPQPNLVDNNLNLNSYLSQVNTFPPVIRSSVQPLLAYIEPPPLVEPILDEQQRVIGVKEVSPLVIDSEVDADQENIGKMKEEIIKTNPVLHKLSFKERFQIAFDEALHHKHPVDDLIEEIKHKEKWQEEHQDELETEKYKEIEKICEESQNKQESTGPVGFIKKEINQVISGISNLFTHYEQKEQGQDKQQLQNQQQIGKSDNDNDIDIDDMFIFGES